MYALAARFRALPLLTLLFGSPAAAELQGRWADRDSLLGADAFVYDLTVFRGELIAAGRFHRIGGIEAHCVARFDGATWRPLGAGLSRLVGIDEDPATDAWAQQLFEFEGDLIVAGRFTHADGLLSPFITRWDGTRFHSMGVGPNNRVAAVGVNDGRLVIGGYFGTADGAQVSRVATWSGNGWGPMERGFSSSVTALYEFQGELWAGGSFLTTGTRPARSIARWADGLWMGVEPGFISLSQYEPATVFCLTEHRGELYAAGHFQRWGDSARVSGIALWSGDAWVAVGGGLSSSGQSYWGSNILTFQDELVVVGNMQRAGGELVNNIASFDGERWADVGLGTNAEIKGCAAFQDELYIGGIFTRAGPYEARHLAVWMPAKQLPAPPLITSLALSVYPNPSRNAATIRTALVHDDQASLELFDVRGRLLRAWSLPELVASAGALSFDGRDSEGRDLAAGVYRFLLTDGRETKASAFVLQRR